MIQPLAWELPYAAGMALKRKKKKKKKRLGKYYVEKYQQVLVKLPVYIFKCVHPEPFFC